MKLFLKIIMTAVSLVLCTVLAVSCYTDEGVADLLSQSDVLNDSGTDDSKTETYSSGVTQKESKKPNSLDREDTNQESTKVETTQNEDKSNQDNVKKESIGLAYELCTDINKQKYYIVAGVGSCIDFDIIIPSTYNGLPVTKIDDGAFENDYRITSVTISDGITVIGERAFYGCDNLYSVTISDSVTVIEKEAFWCCYMLSNVKLGNNLKRIKTLAFSSCALKSITIPVSIMEIGIDAFYDCKKLTIVNYKGTQAQWEDVEKYYSGISSSMLRFDYKG